MATKRQRAIIGHPRRRLPSLLEARIWKEVDRQAKMFKASRSFVVAVALADAMGIKLSHEDRYDTPRRVHRRSVRRRRVA